MKLLFHVHTNNSKCSNLDEKILISFLDRNDFDIVFVTDHNNLTKINWENGLTVLSEEIETGEGDVVGLFLKERIMPNLGIKKTVAEIKKQGGLAVAVHPGDFMRREAMSLNRLKEHVNDFDIIESYNARTLLPINEKLVRGIAKKFNKPLIVGADAHFSEELNNAWFEMPTFNGPSEFLEQIKNSDIHTKRAGVRPHLKTFVKKYITGR